MPGRLRKSFRSGNLAEDFGLLLLKGVAAVAEVSRPEDVGLDAVASILRPGEDGNCYAEDSFVIQLKSESQKTIEYESHALTWLLRQTHPMFIGVVSLKGSRLALYPTIHVNAAFHALSPERMVLHFGKSEKPPFLRGLDSAPWGGNDVWLGDPLLTWSLKDLSNQEFGRTAYQILKRFLPLVRTALALLSLDQGIVLDWTPNNLESIRYVPGIARGTKEGLASIRERIASMCNAVAMHANSLPDGAGVDVIEAVVRLSLELRAVGIEVDAEKILPHLVDFLRRRKETWARAEATQPLKTPPEKHH